MNTLQQNLENYTNRINILMTLNILMVKIVRNGRALNLTKEMPNKELERGCIIFFEQDRVRNIDVFTTSHKRLSRILPKRI